MEGGREGGKEGGMEGGMEGGKEGKKEGGSEGKKEGGRERKETPLGSSLTSNSTYSGDLPSNHVIHEEALLLSGHHYFCPVSGEVGSRDGKPLDMNTL